MSNKKQQNLASKLVKKNKKDAEKSKSFIAQMFMNAKDPSDITDLVAKAEYISDLFKLANIDKQMPIIKCKANVSPLDDEITVKDLSLNTRGPMEDEAYAIDATLLKNIRRGNTLLELRQG